MKSTESRIQSECYMYFHNNFPNLRGRLFCINNNPRNAIDGNRLKAQGMVAGVSDMMFLRSNQPPLCIEFKVGNNSQQQVQKQWQAVAESTGAEYVVVRSLDEFKELISKKFH